MLFPPPPPAFDPGWRKFFTSISLGVKEVDLDLGLCMTFPFPLRQLGHWMSPEIGSSGWLHSCPPKKNLWFSSHFISFYPFFFLDCCHYQTDNSFYFLFYLILKLYSQRWESYMQQHKQKYHYIYYCSISRYTCTYPASSPSPKYLSLIHIWRCRRRG